MGFWSCLFGKKKKAKYEIEESNDQEQYLKEDFDEPKKKSEPKSKKVAEPIQEAKAEKETPQKTESNTEKETVNEPKEIKSQKDSTPLPQNESKTKKTGRFEIKKAKDGRFVFNLYAPNHLIVATSQVYSSSSAAVNGIQSIIANAEKAPIEDNTLKNPTKQGFPKWEMYIDKGGEYRFRLYATNGNCVVHSQGYKQKSSCKNGIESIIRCSKNAEIDKSYLKNSKL